MLLDLHERYTLDVLQKIDGISENIAIEVLKGSFVNDLCETTEEYIEINHLLDKYLRVKSKKGLLDYSAFYQSHLGKLSALHCMANIDNEPPKRTQENVLNWLEFLEFLIFNVDEDVLNTRINKFQNILGNSVADLKFKVSSLLDTHDVFKAKYRAMGMILHIIQDSYTVSHSERGNDGIIAFYCYSEQSSSKHKKHDFVREEHEEKMLSDIRDVLTQLLNDNSAKSCYQNIFKVSISAEASSDGGFQ